MPAFTQDVDCVGREQLPVRGRLLWDSLGAFEFEWVPRGDDQPPAEKYVWPNQRRPDVEIEFLVPIGPDDPRRTVQIQDKIVAQGLRNLDILTDRPLEIRVDEGSPLAGELVFRGTMSVPRVGHFAIQKGLIHEGRNREQRIKDVAYVFDLLDGGNGLADRVLEDVLAAREPWGDAVERFRTLIRARLDDHRFMLQVAAQFPVEGGATPRYIREEVAGWLRRFDSFG